MPYKKDVETGKYIFVPDSTGASTLSPVSTSGSTKRYSIDPKTGKATVTSVASSGSAPSGASARGKRSGGVAADAALTKSGTPNVNSVAGLSLIAEGQGGGVAARAKKVTEEDKKPGLFTRVLDFISRPQYAATTAFKYATDKDPNTTYLQGAKEGLFGQTKTTGSELLGGYGWNPKSTGGKLAKGVTGFALDVLFDPLTYVTLGASGLEKAGVEGLTKAGSEQVAKRLALTAGKTVGKAATKESISLLGKEAAESVLVKNITADEAADALRSLALKDPELAKKFFEQGGVKVFGKTIASSQAIKQVIEKVPLMKQIDELTAPLRYSTYALFDSRYTPSGLKPREVLQLEQRMKDVLGSNASKEIKSLTDLAFANKLTSQEAENVANALETGLKIADPRLENVRLQMSQFFGKRHKELQTAGVQIGELKNYFTHLLVDEDAKAKSLLSKKAGSSSLGFAKEQEIKKLTNETTGKVEFNKAASAGLTETKEGKLVDKYGNSYTASQATAREINEAFGKKFFEEDVIKAAAVYAVATRRAIDQAEMIREAKKFGLLAERAPSNHIETGIKELKGYKFHPEVAAALANMNKAIIGDEATTKLLRQYDKITNLWKATVTSVFPAFHGRNGISNVLQNMLDIGGAAVSPTRNALAVTVMKHESVAAKLEYAMKKGGKTAQEAKIMLDALNAKKIMTDFAGKTYTFGELRDLIKKNNIAFNGDYVGFMDIAEDVGEKIGHATNLKKAQRAALSVSPLSQEFLPFRAGRKLGTAIEEQARLLNFMTNLEKTGSAERAAARTKQFLFDYANLTPFEKTVMKRLIPFYTWPRKNMELQLRTLLTNPGKITAQGHAIGNLANALQGDNALTDDELALLPDYLREGLTLPISRDGQNFQLLTQLQIPAEQATKFLPTLLESLNPAIKLGIELKTGYSFFRDARIDETYRYVSQAEYDSLPKVVKDYVGFVPHTAKSGNTYYSAVDPVRYHLIQSLPGFSSTDSLVKTLKEQKVDTKLKILRFLTGVRTSGEKNLDDLAEQLSRDQREELQKILGEAGILSDITVLPKKERLRIFNK